MADPANPHAEISYGIIGAAIRVHRRTTRGLREQHCQKAQTAELLKAGLSCPAEHHVEIVDGEVWIGRQYLDHWVNDCVVVETKAFAHPLGDREIGQAVNYVAALDAKVGLLLNFGRPSLEYRRSLPPKAREGWQSRIGQYLRRPGQQRAED